MVKNQTVSVGCETGQRRGGRGWGVGEGGWREVSGGGCGKTERRVRGGR